MRCSYQLFALETADLDEGLIAVGDLAFHISGGNQALLRRKGAFALGNGLVVSHACRFLILWLVPDRSAGAGESLAGVTRLRGEEVVRLDRKISVRNFRHFFGSYKE